MDVWVKKMYRILGTKAWIVFTVLLLSAHTADAVRIKDFVNIRGVRNNQLVGYGLVIGLNGTGDGKNAQFTFKSLASMLELMGMTVDPKEIRKVENVAAVMVTAELPPFARAGGRIDVTVSSIGDAETLQGGVLLMTPLKGADGRVYAAAQGPLSIGGFTAGGGGTKIQKNFPTVGRIPNGAFIEREIASDFNRKENLFLTLKTPDFTNASRIAGVINQAFRGHIARTLDSGTVELKVPEAYAENLVRFVTNVEALSFVPDTISRVVVNERTGTVVVGENVRISTIAVAHGNLSIQIKETPNVSQPLPFSDGRTVVTSETDAVAEEGNEQLILVESGASIGEVVRALNALGVSPRDLIAIFQAFKSAAALQAELEIM